MDDVAFVPTQRSILRNVLPGLVFENELFDWEKPETEITLLYGYEKQTIIKYFEGFIRSLVGYFIFRITVENIRRNNNLLRITGLKGSVSKRKKEVRQIKYNRYIREMKFH